MIRCNSDLSEHSAELEFFSLTSDDSEDCDNTFYNTADENLSDSVDIGLNKTIEFSSGNYKAKESYQAVNPSGHTTADVITNQIFDGWDSPIKLDTKLRFEKCFQFFSELSNKNNPSVFSSNCRKFNLMKLSPKFNESINISRTNRDNSTNTLLVNKVDNETQTKIILQSYPERGFICLENGDKNSFSDHVEKESETNQLLIKNKCLCNLSTVGVAGDSLVNAVTAIATTVVSIKNGNRNRVINHSFTVHSQNSKVSCCLASSKSICLCLSDCENDLSRLLSEQAQPVIKLSTSCLIKRNNRGKENIIIDNPYSFVVPQLTHISNSCTSSSSSSLSEESLQGASKVFVATPVTMSTALNEISNNSNSIKYHNSDHLKRDVIPKDLRREHLKLEISPNISSDKFAHQHKILQSVFFRTSTPLSEAQYKKEKESKSFKELSLDSVNNNLCSFSIGQKKSQTISHQKTNCNNKRVYLSLYNLTCQDLFGVEEIPTMKNPTNIFFSHSKSYGSLKETDIDSGLEIYRERYKETDLDKYNKTNKRFQFKTSSLNNLYPSKPDPSLVICPDLDENILNKCISTGSVSKSCKSLYSRLCDKAETPIQMRVAKSITKLNIPSWLSSVEFIEKDQTTSKVKKDLRMSDIKIKSKPKLKGIAKTLNAINSSHKSRATNEKVNVSLPSEKYSHSIHRLEPITCSKARNILIECQKEKVNKSRSYSENNVKSIQTKLEELSFEFLSQFPNLRKSFINIKNSWKSSETKSNNICAKIACSKLISKMKDSLIGCNECQTVYCSNRCQTDDLNNHSKICYREILQYWLSFLVGNLSKNQIVILSEISKIGLENFGKGFVLWTIERTKSQNIFSKFLKYSLASDSKSFGIEIDGNKVNRSEFLFVLSLIIDSNNNRLTESKYFSINGNLIQSKNARIIAGENFSVNKHRDNRQNLFNEISKLLCYFNVNIQETYPAFYFHLIEYVTNGILFSNQNFIVSDPVTGSKIKLIIVPDQVPLQIPID